MPRHRTYKHPEKSMWTELLNVLKALKYSPYVMTCILLRHILTAARLQVWFSLQPVALAWMGKSSSRRQLRHRLSPPCYKFSSVCIEGVLFPLTACEYLQVNVAACCSSLNEWVNEWDMRIINTVSYGQKLQLLGCTRPYYPKIHASFQNGNPNLRQSIIYPRD